MSSPTKSSSEQIRDEPESNNETDIPDKKSKVNEEKSDTDSKLLKEDNGNSEVVQKVTEDIDDDDEEDEEEEVGLLDRPVEVFGSRERKKVQRLEINFGVPPKDKAEIPEGIGDKLGDCPRIEHQIQKNTVGNLKLLHKFLFGRVGTANEIKKNIRKFCGFAFKEGSPEYEKKKASFEKIKISVLKHACEVLDLEKGGTKEDITLRILSFLLMPKDSGKKVPQSKKKSKKGVKRKSMEKKKSASTSNKKKKESSSETENETNADSDDQKTDSDEEEDEEIPKKKQKVIAKKSKPEPKKVTKTAKKTGKKQSPKKKAVSSDESSEDDEPLIKKSKSPPTNEEIKAHVTHILKSADLEEITMKTVIKQVFEKYPDFDLSNKKEFIKATVKSVIS